MTGPTPDPPQAQARVPIVNRLGLHARAAAKLVTVAERFAAEIEIARAGQGVDACSIMGLMMLGAARGEDVLIAARGPDAQAAVSAIGALIADGFGERD